MSAPPSFSSPSIPADPPEGEAGLDSLLTADGARRALWLRLSMLPEGLRRPQYLRLAISGLAAAAGEQAGILTLDGGDVLVVCEAERTDRMTAAAFATCRLFSQPPDPAAGEPGLRFVSWYDLPKDAASLREHLAADHERQLRTPPTVAENLAKRLQLLDRKPSAAALTPSGYAGLVDAVQRVDLFPLLRRQTAFAWPVHGRPAPRFDEVYVSMAAVRSTLFSGIDVTSDASLFRHLTGILDRRLLAALSKPEAIGETAEISINLNLPSVFSPAFDHFDDNLNAARVGTVIVEVPAVDVLADLPLFLRARDRLRELGYRVALDGLGWRDLDLVDSGMLGVDLIKIIASAGDIAASAPERDALRQAVATAGPHRLVMCRVDEEAAVDLGHAVGIEVFQGRHVDRAVSELNRRRHRAGLKRLLVADT